MRPERVLESAPAKLGQRGAQAAAIAAELRREIIAGSMEPGVRLGQEQLAHRFGVSRMPVREALKLLVADGLVAFDPNKGARVTQISLEDLREIYEMRMAAESLALKIAIPELSNSQIDKAEALQDQLESATFGDFGGLNSRFHRTLYEPCDRPRLLAHIDSLSSAADRYLCTAVAQANHAVQSHKEHRSLLVACRNRDEETAIACLTDHIIRGGETLGRYLEKQQA
ncbi:MAG: GntR family transcriptional regulator [Stappiaceae bacterium]